VDHCAASQGNHTKQPNVAMLQAGQPGEDRQVIPWL
jgi:hypothetical protein